MKKILLTIALFTGSLSQAFIDLPGKITKIDADLRCEQQGGGLAIKYPTGTKEGRVWHSEPGQDEGLELEVTSFNVARCPGCLNFEASLMGTKVNGVITNFNLVYSGTDDDGQTKEMLKVKCVAATKPEGEKVIKSKSAYLKICPATVDMSGKSRRFLPAPGCLNKIVIKGKELVVSSDNDLTEKILNNIIGTNQLHKSMKSLPFTAEGRMDKLVVMGYERDVFVVTKIDQSTVVLPRGF